MSYGRATGAARGLAERGGVLARAAGERGGRGSKWAACWRGADVEGHRLARGGGSRWPGGAASTVGCPAWRSRARLWLASVAFPHPRASTCIWQLKGAWAKAGECLGCSERLRGEREAEDEEEKIEIRERERERERRVTELLLAVRPSQEQTLARLFFLVLFIIISPRGNPPHHTLE